MLAALGTSMTQQRQLVQDSSHELRTPLTSVLANSELLERSDISAETRTSLIVSTVLPLPGRCPALVLG